MECWPGFSLGALQEELSGSPRKWGQPQGERPERNKNGNC